MSLKDRKIGGESVGAIGLGLMGLTWRPTSTPDDQAFALIKNAVDNGCNFLNAGEFYNRPDDPLANLTLLKRFFDKYPDYAPKVVLSVKGGINKDFSPDASREGVRRSVETIQKALGTVKKLDMFECARVDKKVPIEDTASYVGELVKEGAIKYFGLSEVSAETIRRAHKVFPVAAVEVEYSLFSTDIETNGVLDACKELGITLVAYSPVARGLLTGEIKSPADIPEGDIRRHLDRFQPANFDANLKLVDLVKKQAEAKGVTVAQLAIAWVANQWEGIVPIPGSTSTERMLENQGSSKITFTEQEALELRKLVDSFEVKGGRYNDHMKGSLEG
eukprot:TRINITY_DN3224_c0_g1_i1.p1 TRINITY_DN3224_c0_g1~~TRINITY_DN3224_c0_g1_i1.p1  ORF type:complete len:333 (+),score=113.89 TRINITY_DN3224_c0_g1_i1:93-1091(+)